MSRELESRVTVKSQPSTIQGSLKPVEFITVNHSEQMVQPAQAQGHLLFCEQIPLCGLGQLAQVQNLHIAVRVNDYVGQQVGDGEGGLDRKSVV